MFILRKTSTCSFVVFLSHIHISSPVDGRMCLILPSIRLLIWMCEGNAINTACKSLPEDEHLDFRNMSKTLLKLKHYFKKCEFCWFLLHIYITLHGSKNVNLTNCTLMFWILQFEEINFTDYAYVCKIIVFVGDCTPGRES